MARKTPEEYRKELERKRGLFHSRRWAEKKAAEYEARYYAEVQAESDQYLDSELVQNAGKEIADFYICKLIPNVSHQSDLKTVECSMYLETDETKIQYYDSGARMSPAVGMRMMETDPALWRELNARFYAEEYHEIRYTGEGWRFEKIVGADKLRAVTMAIARTVIIRVQEEIRLTQSLFPYDGNSSVSMYGFGSTDSSCEVTIKYTADNLRYIAEKSI